LLLLRSSQIATHLVQLDELITEHSASQSNNPAYSSFIRHLKWHLASVRHLSTAAAMGVSASAAASLHQSDDIDSRFRNIEAPSPYKTQPPLSLASVEHTQPTVVNTSSHHDEPVVPSNERYSVAAAVRDALLSMSSTADEPIKSSSRSSSKRRSKSKSGADHTSHDMHCSRAVSHGRSRPADAQFVGTRFGPAPCAHIVNTDNKSTYSQRARSANRRRTASADRKPRAQSAGRRVHIVESATGADESDSASFLSALRSRAVTLTAEAHRVSALAQSVALVAHESGAPVPTKLATPAPIWDHNVAISPPRFRSPPPPYQSPTISSLLHAQRNTSPPVGSNLFSGRDVDLRSSEQSPRSNSVGVDQLASELQRLQSANHDLHDRLMALERHGARVERQSVAKVQSPLKPTYTPQLDRRNVSTPPRTPKQPESVLVTPPRSANTSRRVEAQNTSSHSIADMLGISETHSASIADTSFSSVAEPLTADERAHIRAESTARIEAYQRETGAKPDAQSDLIGALDQSVVSPALTAALEWMVGYAKTDTGSALNDSAISAPPVLFSPTNVNASPQVQATSKLLAPQSPAAAIATRLMNDLECLDERIAELRSTMH
jgi:hypothetical protein